MKPQNPKNIDSNFLFFILILVIIAIAVAMDVKDYEQAQLNPSDTLYSDLPTFEKE